MSVDVPDQKGRLEILQVHARNKKFADDVELREIALRTPGFSGADLANLLNEVRACLQAPQTGVCLGKYVFQDIIAICVGDGRRLACVVWTPRQLTWQRQPP